MEFKSFTRRYVDKSNTTGLQFEFLCDLCTSSHTTSFQYEPMGVAASLVTAAGWLVRGSNKDGDASQQLNQLLRGKSWDDAYARAVDEAKKSFTQCSRCRKWVCSDRCWAKDARLCRGCVPDLAAESAAKKAQAGKFQLFGKALAWDQTGARDMRAPQLIKCLHCGRSNVGGNFCADCGKPMILEIPCNGCDASWAVHLNYHHCPSCGSKMPNDLSRARATLGEQEAAAPKQEAAAPKQEAAAPKQEAAAPKQEAAAPEQAATAPEQAAVAPKQEAAAPEQAATAPKQTQKSKAQTQNSSSKAANRSTKPSKGRPVKKTGKANAPQGKRKPKP